VPGGFVVPSATCARVLDRLCVREELRRLRNAPPEEIEPRCASLRRRIAAADLDPS